MITGPVNVMASAGSRNPSIHINCCRGSVTNNSSGFGCRACVIVPAAAVKLVKADVPPTAPVKVVVPVPPTIDNVLAPFKVLLKPIFALLEVMMLLPVKLTGLAKVKGLAPDTLILFPI